VSDGQLQTLAHRRVEARQPRRDRLSGHAQVLGAHAVETLGGVAHGGGPAHAHILNGGDDSLQSGGGVEARARQGLGEFAGGQVLVAQIDSGEHAGMLAGPCARGIKDGRADEPGAPPMRGRAARTHFRHPHEAGSARCREGLGRAERARTSDVGDADAL
jgi:hypothetical protein